MYSTTWHSRLDSKVRGTHVIHRYRVHQLLLCVNFTRPVPANHRDSLTRTDAQPPRLHGRYKAEAPISWAWPLPAVPAPIPSGK